MSTAGGAQRQTVARFGLAFALLAALLASVFSLGTARAAVNVNSIQSYQQNFDSLTTSGGTQTWTNDVTLKGWYAATGNTSNNTDITTYTAFTAATGTDFPGGLYSFGSGSDRALGLIGSSATGTNPKRMGVVLKNTTGVAMKTLTVAYTGEQWLDANTTTSTLQFKYKPGTNLGAADIKTSNGLKLLPALDFTGPQNAAAGPINGNLPANSKRITQTITLSPDVPNNGEIFLVWEDDNIGGDDHGLAVDDLVVTATLASNAPAKATCPSPLTVFQGSATSQAISAIDPDGVISGATITSGGAAGITLNQNPAVNAGDTYTATISADVSVAPSTYNLAIQFQNATTANQAPTCTVALTVAAAPADLAVSKDGPVDYKPGEQLTYNIIVRPGAVSATANDVVVTDTLPANLTYISNTSGVTPTVTGQNVQWNFGTLTAPKSFDLVAASAAASGTLTNTVSASTSSPDADQSNNTDTAVTTQRPAAPDFNGSSKDVDNPMVQVGEVFAYTLTVSNSGDLDGTFTLTDVLPNSLTVVSATGFTQNGQTLTATGPIAAGQEISYTLSVQANTAGTVNNVAQLTGDGQTRTLDAPTVTVLAQATPANFSGSTKTVDVTQAAPGDEVTYTITVVNSGQAQGSFVLTDTLDANLTLVSAFGLTANGQTLRTSDTVNGGQSREYTIIARINPNTPQNTVIRNNATLAGDGQSRTLNASTVTVIGNGEDEGFDVYLPLINK